MGASQRVEDSFFTWRPVAGAGATLLSRCCSRRLLYMPLPLLCQLLNDRRLPLAPLQGVVAGLESCGPWSPPAAEPLIPGGVIWCQWAQLMLAFLQAHL